MKVGGVRVEPAEIEAAIASHEAVSAAVARLVQVDGRSTLVAWIVPVGGGAVDTADVRRHAGTILHRAVVPSHVVAVEALPTTPNGKVDTAALRERFASAMATAPAADSVDAEQPSPVEEAVADDVAAVLVAMRDLLGRDVGADDDFFESGGDSLAGLDLAAALRATGYRLEDAVVFEELTARRIADRMEAVAAEAFVARPAHVPPPLTPGEAALLFEHQNDPDDPRYQVGRRVLVGTAGTPAEVDVDRLAMAFQSVVSRHPSFTWTYASPRVRRRPDRLVEFDLPSAASAAVDVDTFDALLATLQRRPLDPTCDDAPLRLLIRRLVDGRLAVGLAAHHVSLDATTFDVLWEQIDDEYSGRPGPDLSGPDLADLLAATVDPDDPLVAARLERWLDRVDRPTAELDLGRPVRAADGVVSRPLGVAIDQLSIRDATPFATLLAAFACALRRRADGDGIGVGIVATVREHAAMRYQLGYHMNTLPVVVDTATPRLGDVVDAAGRLSTDALIDRATPLSSIVAALRSGGGPRGQATQPTINAMIAFERYAAGALGDLPVHSTATWAGSAVTDVTLFCHVQGDEAILQIEYSGDVLDEGGARVLLDDVAHLAHLATTGDEVDHHDVALPSSMPALPAPEAVEPPPALGTLIRAAAGAAEPDAPAVVADRIMSWAELDETSAKVAGWLDEQVSTPAVGVVTTRTATTVAALLGVQRAGCAYVPLDPSYPESHLAHVLADTGADLVLVDGAFDDVSSRLPGDVRVVSLDEVASSAAAPSDAWPTDPSAPAYVIHTSGSTGLPKGVPVNQGNIGHSTDSRADAYPSSPAAFLMVSPMGFDSSMVGLWWPLATGGTVVLPDDHRRDDPDHLLGLIASERITHTLMLPSLWEILLDAARPGDPALAGLETVIVAGEACSPDLVAKHQALLPRCLLANEYGPTETTVWSHRHLFDTASAASESPIGEVLPGGVSMVADDALRPRPADVPGELLIAGPGVTDGYLDRSDETAARFVELNGRRWYRTGDLVTVDVDGVHRFHGRLDDQVKIRGHRIELDAVDAAGQRLDGVDAAAAAVVELPDGRSVLVLHVVPSDGVTVDAASEEGWRARLTEELPAAAVPSRFVPTSALPTRPNGKVDRRALVAATPTSPAPSTTRRTAGGADEGLHPHASRLLTAWTEVLGVDGIGVDDDFFDLGGDSIVAIRIAAALRPHGVTFTPRSIFEHSTVRTLAPLLTPIEAGQDGPVAGEVPLLPAQRWFEALAPRDVVRWTQHLELDLARPVEGELLERFGRALDRLVDHHEALRMRFELSEGRLRQLAGPRTRRVPVASASNSAEAVERLGELLDLNEGVLLGAVVIEDRPGWVLLGAHHLVVDAVSFGLLVDDLDALLAGASALPSRGTSVAGWADHLVSLDQPDLPASWSVPDLTGTEGSTAARTVDVDVPTTAALAALGRPIDEVVAAAIAAAAPAAAPSLLHAGCLDVTLERHGREGVAPIDLSRTVGWFTTTDRMCVDGLVPDVAVSSVFDTVARLGDQQRASLLTDARRAMAGQLAANDVVRVNHLGAVTGRRLDTIRSVGPLIGTIAATNTRGQQLGVLVRDVAGGLAITVDHSAADLSAPEFEALVDALPAVLSELAEQGEGHGQQSSGGDTGRFDLAGLDQAGFDALEAALASLD